MKTNFGKYFGNLMSIFMLHWKALAFALAVMMFFYVFMVSRSNGWFAWVLSVPPGIVIMITAWCRVTDMSACNLGWHWQARKVGLALAGSGAAAVMVAPFTTHQLFPGWEVLIMMWGFALAWLTTPNMVPWWRYITGTTPASCKGGAEE